MSDLISRKAVLEEIQKIEREPGYQHVGEDWSVGLNIAESIVYSAESVKTDERLIPKEPILKTGESLIGTDYIDKPGDTWISKWAEWCCPTCGWFVGEQYVPRRHNQQKSNYCSRCGQAIDWDGIEPEKYARYEKKQQQISEFKKIEELIRKIIN